MTTSTTDDKNGTPSSPRHAAGSRAARRVSSGGGGSRMNLHIVTDDPDELARLAQEQAAARAQGLGAEPLLPGPPVFSNSLSGSQYTESLPAFLNTDRVRDQVARRVPDSAWQEVAPVDPSLTSSIGDGYEFLPFDADVLDLQEPEELAEEDLAAHRAMRDERREERRRRAQAQGRRESQSRQTDEAPASSPGGQTGQTGAHAPQHVAPASGGVLSSSQAAAAAALASVRGSVQATTVSSSDQTPPRSGSTGRHAAIGSTGRHAAVGTTGKHAAVGQTGRHAGIGSVNPAATSSTGQHAAVASASIPAQPTKPRMPTLVEIVSANPQYAAQVTLVVASALIAIAISVWMLYTPAQQLYLAIRENERLADELEQNYARNDRMQRRVDYLQTEEGIQDEAHRVYGYVMPGEHAVTVEGVEVDDPYAGSGVVGGIERGSGQNTHSTATDILDRIFGTGETATAAEDGGEQ